MWVLILQDCNAKPTYLQGAPIQMQRALGGQILNGSQ